MSDELRAADAAAARKAVLGLVSLLSLGDVKPPMYSESHKLQAWPSSCGLCETETYQLRQEHGIDLVFRVTGSEAYVYASKLVGPSR